MKTVLACLFLFAHISQAQTQVPSREQLRRILPAGLPNGVAYNDDRVVLRIQSDEGNCPVNQRGFFEIRVDKTGAVESVKLKDSSSGSLKQRGVEFLKGLLKRIKFKPLMIDNKPVSVQSYASVVCEVNSQ